MRKYLSYPKSQLLLIHNWKFHQDEDMMFIGEKCHTYIQKKKILCSWFTIPSANTKIICKPQTACLTNNLW